jgi:hypothetical protein
VQKTRRHRTGALGDSTVIARSVGKTSVDDLKERATPPPREVGPTP